MAKPLQFKCTSCGQVVTIPAPQGAGLFQVICPYCGHVLKIKYTPKPIKMAPMPTPIATPIPTPIPTPQSAPQQPYAAPAPSSASNKNDAVEKARHAPTQRWGSLGDMLGGPVQSAAGPRPASQVGGGKTPKLSMVRLGMDKQYFPLHDGDNFVGRKDPMNPIDVEIEGDGTISRRSVCIHVERYGASYTYSLMVLKATNPVMVNNATIPVGQTATLAVGNSICLGQTLLRLEES